MMALTGLSAPPRAESQTCDTSARYRGVSISFENKAKNGSDIFGSIAFKLAGASDGQAFYSGEFGGLPNTVYSDQIYQVDMNAYQTLPLDVRGGASGHCDAPWQSSMLGTNLIEYPTETCAVGWGSYSYKLLPCQWAPDLRCDGPGQPNLGEPVSVVSGNVWFDSTDATLPNLVFTRSYNSLVAYANGGGVFGKGWYHSFEKEILSASAIAETANLMLVERDGTAVYFEPAGDGTLRAIAPGTERSWLVPSGGGHTRNFFEGGYETYNAQGKLTSIVPAAGPTVTLTRDGSGRILTISDGARTLTLEYDAESRVSRLTGPAGEIARYAYLASGMLETVSYPDGSGYRYAYDATSGYYVTAVTDFGGTVLERHTYDTQGRGLTSEKNGGRERLTFDYSYPPVTKVTDAEGNPTVYAWRPYAHARRVTQIMGPCPSCAGGSGETESWTYDVAGRVLTHTTRAGTTTYTYDTAGNRLTETDPLDNTTTYTYDSQGRVLTASKPDGGLTTYTHAVAGPLTITEKVTTSQNRTTTLTYTSGGRLETITDPRCKTTTLAYNGLGDLTSVTDPLSHATTFGYDSMGRRTTVTDAISHTTTTTYDARGRVTAITYHDSTHTDFAYDLGGRRASATDPLGRKTSYYYDAYGRLEAVIDPIGGATRCGYDLASNLTSLTDAKGQTTNFEYDTFNRVARVVYPGGAYETFTYDPAGRLSAKTDRKSVATTYAYDVAGRLTGKTYSDSTPAVSYTYDDMGRLLTAANGTDTLTWTYNLSGQLLSEQSTKNSSTVAYTYDLGGNRLSVSLNGSAFVTYAYDDASRLTTITRGSSNFGFGYDNANRRTSMTYPHGINTSYSYDNLNRLTRLKADLSSTPLTDFQYVYDAAGNRTKKQQLDYTEDYSYDPLYRLTGVERSAGLTGIGHYSYDPVGNRVTNQINDSVLTAAFNEKNQLTASSGGGTLKVRGTLDEPGTAKVNGNPARMLAGNVFEATIQATTGTNTFAVEATDQSGNITNKNYQVSVIATGATYTYDLNGNLTQKVEGADTWTYTWDAEDRLKKVEKNGVEQARFAYDAIGRRVEKVAGGVTTSWTYDRQDLLREIRGTTTLKYIQGPATDEPLATDDGSALTYFHADVLGSVNKTTSAAGAVTLVRRYDPSGNLELRGTTSGYAFTGREWDPEAELYYYRARSYEPRSGRFLTEDPIGMEGGTNLYGYVTNNPVNLRDPFGLFPNPIRCIGSNFTALQLGWMVLTQQFPRKDKRAHCLAFCHVTNGCGNFLGGMVITMGVGLAKEAFDSACFFTLVKGAGWLKAPCTTPWDNDDIRANMEGASLPPCGTERDCEARCSKF